jgi:Flp pilus assembly protein TadD
VEIKKEDPWAHFRLGWIYVRSGDRARGVDHLKKSLIHNPDNVDVLTKLGEVLMRDSATFDEAEQYITKALALDSKNSECLVCMGRILDRKGKTE